MVLCTERSLVKHDANRVSVRPLRCKCWGCDHCVHKKRRDLWFKAFKGDPQRFLTLTVRQGHFTTPEETAREMVKGWRMLRQFLERSLNIKKITFLAVFEAHESGWPHLHILLRGSFIHHHIIRKWWTERFDSFQIDIRYVKNTRQRANYVSKYVSEAPEVFAGCRRFWCSQDWDPPRKEDDVPQSSEFAWWESVMINPLGIARMALQDRATVECKGDLWVISNWAQMDRWRWGIG
jgi:hypothetical protein